MPQPAHPQGLPSSIVAGAVIGEKYRLEHELGTGAMGTVWAAVHLSLGQRVAIKLIAAEHTQSPEARQRFSVEAKAAAKLRSRYVVQVYDDGQTAEGTPYIVMEYLEGETLEARIEKSGPLPLPEGLRVMRHVSRALSRAHALGIVHRDLKPSNIFLTHTEDDDEAWVAKVVDFGIAKLDEQRDHSITKTGTVLGTPLFMSPEQVRGASSVDLRADIYSLGMVFYNLLTAKYAFDSPSFGDLLVNICTSPLPRLTAEAPSLPPEIDDWFFKCCARDPEARFSRANEALEALFQAAGTPSSAPRGSTWSRQSAKNRAFYANDTDADNSGAYASAKTQIQSADLRSNPGTPIVLTQKSETIPKRPLWPLFLAAAVVLSLGVALVMLRGQAPAAAELEPPSETPDLAQGTSTTTTAVGAVSEGAAVVAPGSHPSAAGTPEKTKIEAEPERAAASKEGAPSLVEEAKTGASGAKAPANAKPAPQQTSTSTPKTTSLKRTSTHRPRSTTSSGIPPSASNPKASKNTPSVPDIGF